MTDLRRGVLVKSEDQEEELLSSVFVGGLRARPGRSKGQKVVVGSSSGVLTLWERGVWDDQDERIIVDGTGRGGGESLDVIALMPENVGDGGKNLVVGVGDGTIRIVKLGPNKVVGELRHDDIEGVVALGFDVGGRMISGGGEIIKIWSEKMNLEEEADEEEEKDSDDEDSDAEDTAPKKRAAKAESDSDDESSDEAGGRKERKKRRKAKGKKDKGNGILGFKGLE